MRLVKKNLLNVASSHLENYPSPINISYFWSFGSLAGLTLVIQIVTGVFLAMHYTPHVDYAFQSVEHIMRDVVNGWLIRYMHANGASMFFTVVYIHILRGIYYGSYLAPRAALWSSGVVLFILMMATGFMGYVLPWGQMSLWGATVITNLFSAIPYVGESIVQVLWGGFSVGNATLNRFFSLHYLLPFAIAAMAVVHIALLHDKGSSNPLGIEIKYGTSTSLPFYPHFWLKDVFSLVLFFIVFSGLVFFAPNILGHPDNYIPANPMVTPPHIVPEWYFLPFYAILRAIPDKLGGVIAMFAAMAVWLLLPIIDTTKVRSSQFRMIHKKVFWFFVGDFVLLGWLGQKVVEAPYVQLGQVATLFYFVYFLVLIPAIGYLEDKLVKQA